MFTMLERIFHPKGNSPKGSGSAGLDPYYNHLQMAEVLFKRRMAELTEKQNRDVFYEPYPFKYIASIHFPDYTFTMQVFPSLEIFHPTEC